MKLNSNSKTLSQVMAACFFGIILTFPPAIEIGKPHKNYMAGNEDPKEKPAKKAKAKSRSFSSRTNSSVRIYPDILKRDMHVLARENDGKEIQFFVFDLEGTLIHNYKLKPKEHIRMTGMARGTYRYHVFCGDEETAAGDFEIR